MPYDVAAVRAGIRARIQNIPERVYPNDKLNVVILDAKREFERDAPREVVASITGTGLGRYKLSSTVVGWVDDFSQIRSIGYPAPLIGQEWEELDAKTYRIRAFTDGDYIDLDDIWDVGYSALVRFTTTWTLQGLDGATITTIPERLRTPFEFLCTSLACRSLATKSAGSLDDQVESDLINYRTQEQEYNNAAEHWRVLYRTALGFDDTGQKGVMVRADFDPTRRHYITHRNWVRY